MKTSTIILAAILTLGSTAIFAGNDSFSTAVTSESTVMTLAPATPAEATFEDAVITESILSGPVTPAEATFEDAVTETSAFDLAPVAPATADFEELTAAPSADVFTLAPVTPAVADFE